MEKRLLPTAQWKLLLCLITLFFAWLAIAPLAHWQRFFVPGVGGTLSLHSEPADQGFRRRIISLNPDSPLAAAGARPGDQFEYVHQGDSNRQLGTDELVPVRLFSGAQSREVLVQPVPEHRSAWSLWIVFGGGFFWAFVTLAIGFLIGWRRADSTAMRILSLGLMAVIAQMAENFLPGGALVEWCSRLAPAALIPLHLGVIYFLLQLPDSAPHWRRGWVRALFYLFSLAMTVETAALILFRCGILQDWLRQIAFHDYVLPAFTPAIVMIVSWFAWRQSTGTERQRVAWIGICFGVKYLGSEYINIIQALSLPLDWLALQPFIFVAIVLSYFGLAYSILRHKLFDVGFAINRVLVYSIMSTLLLTLFSLTEFGVDKLLHFEGREKNVIFDAAVALGIILTFHRIQHWVNHRVDHVFFHHWQVAADKLRAFVERAPHILEPDALQTKFMHAVEEFTGARGTAIYWSDVDGTFRLAHATLSDVPMSIDADDDVAVELRHTRAMVDLSGAPGRLPADLVFPLLAHNQVEGMLLAGPKTGGQSYRPDEIALLGKNVPRICIMLEALRLQKLERALVEKDAQLKCLAAERDTAIAKAELAEIKLSTATVP